MSWCLVKDKADAFKKALKGELHPFKLAEMTSKARHELLAKYVGQENSQQVNALFESKLLLKNQQAGYITWIKRTSGMSPTVKRDLISRVERMDTILNPAENQAFLEDLAASRLGFGVSKEEAQAISKLSNRLTELREKVETEKEVSKDDRLKYGWAKVNIEKYVNDLKLRARKVHFREQPVQKVVDIVFSDTPSTLKSAVASFDNSFWGRQGIKTLLDVRTSHIWFKNFIRSFGDISRQFVSGGKIWGSGTDAVMDSIKADIYSRPNAVNGKYKAGGYDLDVLSEEAFPTSIPEKVPFLGRLFKMSEVAFNGGALRMRADLADRLITKAEKHGVNTLNKEEAEPLGHLVNSMTGRGSIGKAEAMSRELNVLLFSVKFFKSNVDTITAHIFDKKVRSNKFARKEAAKNLFSMALTVSTVLFLAKLFNPDNVDEDLRSTNFGKVKIFGKWVDITGGQAQLIALASRLVPTKHNGEWGRWMKSSSGKYTNLSKPKYGQTDAWDLLIDATFSNKVSPYIGVLRDSLRGEFFGGEPFTPLGALQRSVTPLSIQQYYEMKDDPRTEYLFGSMVLEGLGFSTGVYNYKTFWEKSESKEMLQFKKEVGDKKFQEANNVYNIWYSAWYNATLESSEYKRLSEEGRSSLITKGKAVIKQKVLQSYNFRYKKPKTTQQEKVEKQKIKDLLPK